MVIGEDKIHKDMLPTDIALSAYIVDFVKSYVSFARALELMDNHELTEANKDVLYAYRHLHSALKKTILLIDMNQKLKTHMVKMLGTNNNGLWFHWKYRDLVLSTIFPMEACSGKTNPFNPHNLKIAYTTMRAIYEVGRKQVPLDIIINQAPINKSLMSILRGGLKGVGEIIKLIIVPLHDNHIELYQEINPEYNEHIIRTINLISREY